MATSYLEVPRRLRTSVQTVVRGRYLDRFRSLESLFSPSSGSSVGLRIRQNGAMGLVVALGRSLAGPPFAHLSPRVVGGFVPRDVLVRTPGSPRCVNGGPAILGPFRIPRGYHNTSRGFPLFHFSFISLPRLSFISPLSFHPLISLCFTLSFLFHFSYMSLYHFSFGCCSSIASSSLCKLVYRKLVYCKLLVLRPARRLHARRLLSAPGLRFALLVDCVVLGSRLRIPRLDL